MRYFYKKDKAKPTLNLDGDMVDPPTLFNLNFLITNRLPLWVVNNTNPRGKLVINMTFPNGKTRPLNIDKTTLPYCITDEVGWDTVENGSQDLRQYIIRGLLTMVWPSDAQAMLEDPDAQFELERLQRSEFSANAAIPTKRVQDMQRQVNEASTDLQAGSLNANEINPRVLGLVARLGNDELSAKEGISELKVIEDDLTNKDLSYIINEAQAPKLKKYAQTLLATKTTSVGSSQMSVLMTSSNEEDPLTEEDLRRERDRENQARTFQRLNE